MSYSRVSIISWNKVVLSCDCSFFKCHFLENSQIHCFTRKQIFFSRKYRQYINSKCLIKRYSEWIKKFLIINSQKNVIFMFDYLLFFKNYRFRNSVESNLRFVEQRCVCIREWSLLSFLIALIEHQLPRENWLNHFLSGINTLNLEKREIRKYWKIIIKTTNYIFFRKNVSLRSDFQNVIYRL